MATNTASTTTTPAATKAAAPDNTAPRQYIGPTPVPLMGNLQPCGCTLPADQLSREQQDWVIETVPDAASWYQE